MTAGPSVAGEPVGVGLPGVRGLTPRDLDVLRTLADHSERETAAILGIRRYTVHEHVVRIASRMGVPVRWGGTLKAVYRGLGWLEIP